MAKFHAKIHFFNLNDSSLARRVTASSRKILEIQVYSITKTKNPFETKICLNISLQLL